MATETEVAAHLDLSDRTVRELKSKGVFTSSGRGGYDLDDCRVAYIRSLRERAAGRAGETGELDLAHERARLAKEQADRVAMDNARDRKEMASLPDMTLAVMTLFEVVKGNLSRIGPIVAKSDTKLRSRIERAIEDALEDLSMTRIEEISGGGADGEDAPDDEDAGDD